MKFLGFGRRKHRCEEEADETIQFVEDPSLLRKKSNTDDDNGDDENSYGSADDRMERYGRQSDYSEDEEDRDSRYRRVSSRGRQSNDEDDNKQQDEEENEEERVRQNSGYRRASKSGRKGNPKKYNKQQTQRSRSAGAENRRKRPPHRSPSNRSFETRRTRDTRSQSSSLKKNRRAAAAHRFFNSVPTAHGYSSDDSAKEAYEERNKQARYSIEASQMGERTNDDDDRDDQADGDRYSIPVRKTDSPKAIEPPWSNDTSTEFGPHAMKSQPAADAASPHSRASAKTPESSSGRFEESREPIYDSSPVSAHSKRKKGTPAVSQFTQGFLNGETVDDFGIPAVVSIISKDAEESVEAELSQKEESKTTATVEDDKTTDSKKRSGILASLSSMRLASPGKPKMENPGQGNVQDADLNQNTVQEQKGNKPEGKFNVFGKKNAKTQNKKKLFGLRKKDAIERERSAVTEMDDSVQQQTEVDASIEDVVEKQRSGARPTREGQRPSKLASVSEDTIRVNAKQLDTMYSKSLMSDDGTEDNSPAAKADDDDRRKSAIQSARLKMNRAAKATVATPVELDEYSVRHNPDEPGLVQCLRYYYCVSAANVTNSTLEAAKCTSQIDESDASILMNNADDLILAERRKDGPVSPKVEVILEEGPPPQTVQEKVKSPKQSTPPRPPPPPPPPQSPPPPPAPLRSTSQPSPLQSKAKENAKDEEDEDDGLPEAPDIGLTTAHSLVLEVSGMHLHLDEDSEEKRIAEAMKRARDRASKEDVSVTSIEIPACESIEADQVEEGEPLADVISVDNEDEQPLKERKGWFGGILPSRKNSFKRVSSSRSGRSGLIGLFRKQESKSEG